MFSGPFTIEAAEAVLAAPDGRGVDAYAALEALIDASLLWQHERDGVRVFGMLVLVRAFARESAAADSSASAAARERWVAYYTALARQSPVLMRGPGQLELDAAPRRRGREPRVGHAAPARLARGRASSLDAPSPTSAAEYAWSLYLYLWTGGLLGVVRDWMTELLARAERDGIPLAPRTEAIALYFTRAVAYWQDPGFDAAAGLERSAELFDAVGRCGERGAGSRVGRARAPVGAGGARHRCRPCGPRARSRGLHRGRRHVGARRWPS